MPATVRPAFDWKALPHPFIPGAYTVARRPADGASIEHYEATALSIPSYSKADAQASAECLRRSAKMAAARHARYLTDAAPDLLAALRRIIAVGEGGYPEETVIDAMKQAQAAIAKAEGRS